MRESVGFHHPDGCLIEVAEKAVWALPPEHRHYRLFWALLFGCPRLFGKERRQPENISPEIWL
jgi:hypothetical protein